jgi:hypothetical protein
MKTVLVLLLFLVPQKLSQVPFGIESDPEGQNPEFVWHVQMDMLKRLIKRGTEPEAWLTTVRSMPCVTTATLEQYALRVVLTPTEACRTPQTVTGITSSLSSGLGVKLVEFAFPNDSACRYQVLEGFHLLCPGNPNVALLIARVGHPLQPYITKALRNGLPAQLQGVGGMVHVLIEGKGPLVVKLEKSPAYSWQQVLPSAFDKLAAASQPH